MRYTGMALLILAVLQGCSSDSSLNEERIKLGVFVDSVVQGLTYLATPSGLTGETNASGEFEYEQDDVVEFFVGSLSLGVFQSQPVISPFDVDSLTPSENGREKSKNIITLLQSLDVDREPNNGIDIRTAILNDEFHELQNIDLSAPVYEFSKNLVSKDLLNRLTGDASFVPLEEALIHAFKSGFTELSTTQVYLSLTLDASVPVLAQSGATLVSDGSAIGLVQMGSNNGYLSQTFDVMFEDGSSSQIITSEHASAGAIAAQLNMLDGILALGSSEATITLGGFSNVSGAMSITLNGVMFEPVGITVTQQLIDLGTKINASSLTDITASLDQTNGDLRIIQGRGEDLVFGFSGGAADSYEVKGERTTVTWLTLNSGQTQAVVGGIVNISMDDGISLSNGSGLSPIIANFTAAPFINNEFLPSSSGTYNFASSTAVYDSLGNPHVLTLYFAKQNISNAGMSGWEVHVLIDGENVGDPLLGSEPERATFDLIFNGDGSVNQTLSDAILISNWMPLGDDGLANGAQIPLSKVNGGRLPIDYPPQNSNFEIVLQVSQLAAPFNVIESYQNGIAMTEQFKDSSVLVGQFVASSVQGLRYQSASFSGETNVTGAFQYRVAESTEFFAGGLSLGSYYNDSHITPFSSNRDSADRIKAKNIVRFLQSLDEDQLPENGLDIRSAVANDHNEVLSNLLLNSPPSEFGDDAGHQEILHQLTGSSVFLPLEEALSHTVNEMLLLGISPPIFRTTKVIIEAKLDPADLVIDETFSVEDASTYNHTAMVDIFDSLGNEHNLNLYFVKVSEDDAWKLHTLIDGRDVGDALIGSEPSPAEFLINLGEIEEPVKESFIISNWLPFNSQGEENGAFRPLNKVDGGCLPINLYDENSNFEIEITLSLQASGFELDAFYQDGFTIR